MIINVVNYLIIIIVYIFNRKYINIGIFIYIIFMGIFVGIGFKIYEYMYFFNILELRILSLVFGCLMIFLGFGIFIVIDIGLDLFISIYMIVRDVIKF